MVLVNDVHKNTLKGMWKKLSTLALQEKEVMNHNHL